MTSFSRIHHLLEYQTSIAPDAPALVSPDGSALDYVSWLQAAMSFAEDLRECGVKTGHRIMMVAENSPELAISLMAASMINAWAVPVNARLSEAELARITSHALPAITIYTNQVSDAALAHAEAASAHDITLATGQVKISTNTTTEAEPVDKDAQQVVALLYTTGTTGDPKGVMLTHANLLAAAKMSATHRGLVSDDLIYGALPLTHVFGLCSVFMAAVHAGASIELVPRFDAAETFSALQKRVSVFPAVPQMHARLMAHATHTGIETLSAARLRYISSGGAPLDLVWKQKVERFFSLPLYNGYGLTETSAGIVATTPGSAREDTSTGKPLGGQQIEIIEPDDTGVGEVCARGPNVMKGYYRNEQATRDVLDSDGWFKTGDLGYIDGDGNLHITGRKKELIIRSGFNVFPLEVEAALNQHPHVVQSAVIGIDTGSSEDIVAFIHPLPGKPVSPDDLKQHLQDKLAAYKHPNRWIVSEHLPAAPSGKILKAKLPAMFASELKIVGRD